MKRALYILISLMFLSSCKKEELKEPVTDSSPVFTASAQLDGTSFTLEAGKDDAFMSTYTEVFNGVERYSGKLGTADTYLELGIFEGDLDIQDPFSLKDFQGILQFAAMPLGPLATLSKNDFPNASSIDHIVWFKNGVQSGFNQLSIVEPGKYEICAKVHFYDGAVHTLCNELVLGYTIGADCKIKHILSIDGVLHVWLEQQTTDIVNVDWFLDGTLVANGPAFDADLEPQQYQIDAVITFANGSVRKKAISVDGSMQGHLINDFTFVEMSPSNQIRWDYGVVLNIRKDGKDYTTLTANNLDSSVEITDIQYFGLNAQGKKVYKCTGTISAIVCEVGTSNLVPVSISTSFGVEMN